MKNKEKAKLIKSLSYVLETKESLTSDMLSNKTMNKLIELIDSIEIIKEI